MTESPLEDFKADDEGKREGYFEADGWLSASPGNGLRRVSYDQSAPYDAARDTLGEIVWGGNGTSGISIVCFIIEERKYFVLFEGFGHLLLALLFSWTHASRKTDAKTEVSSRNLV